VAAPRVPPLALRACLASTLVLLLAHAWLYRFLCDDAFISFRYARNLAHGHGLVFNPGLERVEGYTNFLWVVLLAGFDLVGLKPEWAANGLSLAATIALWACVVGLAVRGGRAGFLALVPAVLLGLTRSVAVWSTSGLETRLYELLVVGGVLRTLIELEPDARAVPTARAARRPLAGWLFGLAALTRPEGMMLGGSVALVAAWRLRARGENARSWLLATLGPLLGLFLAHLAFRRAYYGEWLPNTYYAKVGGQLRWDWGIAYLGAFALEYGVVLWLPLIVIGVRRLRRTGRGDAAAVFGAVVVPVLLYVAAIGCDHFEYRPLDVVFPLTYLVLGEGLAALAAQPRTRLLAAVALVAVIHGVVDLPWRSHLEAANEYVSGFPGEALATSAPARDFLEPGRDPVLRLPGLRAIAEAHRSLTRMLTSHFVAIRQEEHRLFLGLATEQGRQLRTLVDAGVLPRDARIAVDCVGAIPYLSDLLVLDRHGLTDAVIARHPAANPGLMAHEKSATLADARRFGVELWAATPVDLVLPLTSPRVLYSLTHVVQDSLPVVVANVEPAGVLVALLPGGFERVAARMPALHLTSAADTAFERAYVARATPAFIERLRSHPDDVDAMNAFAYLLLVQHRAEDALVLYEEVARRVAGDPGVWERIASCQQLLGHPGDERAALERALPLANAAGDGVRAARVAARLHVLEAPR
jgi:arabinofuranosyltransferase